MRKYFGFASAALSYLSLPVSAFAQQIQLSPPAGSIPTVPVKDIPQFLITLLFVLGVIIAIAFLIYGGIKWVLSGGDKTAVESARNHIVAAIVGLVIVAGAFLILNILWTLLTGKAFDLGNLCIPNLKNPTCP